jgi:hypothetical protein
MFNVFKLGSKVAVVAITRMCFFGFALIYHSAFRDSQLRLSHHGVLSRETGHRLLRFINLMYDFGFSAGKKLSDVCRLDDTVNNPNPSLGCDFYRASLAFDVLSWFVRLCI